MKAILFDIGGVIYQGEQAIEGAAETLAWVRKQQIPHLFLTNISSRPRRAIVQRLAAMGISVVEEEILTPPVAATQWLQIHKPGPVALFVPAATQAEFAQLPLLAVEAESGAGAVVFGDLGDGFDFATLNRAFRLLLGEPKPQLIALGMARYWRASDGLQLDAGPFVKALEYAVETEALVLGKPDVEFFQMALDLLGSDAAETLMVGDDIKGDIEGAQKAGLRGLLVRTGKFSPNDLQQGIEPDGIIDSVADLPAWWQGMKQ